MKTPISLLVAAVICAVAIIASTTSAMALDRVGLSQKCKPSGYLKGTSHSCNQAGDSECCKTGKQYPQYSCSPPVSTKTPATLTVNCFGKGSCGGGPSECDDSFHSDDELITALSTGWYGNGKHCHKKIRVFGNGKSVLATVVDECDSVHGCDEEHDYQPPCRNNDVDASPAVWKALGVSEDDSRYGGMPVTWTFV